MCHSHSYYVCSLFECTQTQSIRTSRKKNEHCISSFIDNCSLGHLWRQHAHPLGMGRNRINSARPGFFNWVKNNQTFTENIEIKGFLVLFIRISLGICKIYLPRAMGFHEMKFFSVVRHESGSTKTFPFKFLSKGIFEEKHFLEFILPNFSAYKLAFL